MGAIQNALMLYLYARATQHHPRSLNLLCTFCFSIDRSIWNLFFSSLFSYFWVRAAKNYCLDLLFFSKHQALITVNNFNRRDICSPSLSLVWCVWISLKSTLAAESRFYVRFAFFSKASPLHRYLQRLSVFCIA